MNTPKALATPAVIVIGGANVDIKCRLAGAMIPGTSNVGEVQTSAGGVGRNIAENLARLGVPVAILTAVGNDPDGDFLVTSCRDSGAAIDLIARFAQPTGRYVALLDQQGELIAGVNSMAIMDMMTPAWILQHRPRLQAARLLIADANLPEATLVTLGEIAQAAGNRLVVDPVSVEKCQRLLTLLDQSLPIFLMSPNRDQLRAMTGMPVKTLADIAGAVAGLHARGVANVVAGLGPDGAYVSDGLAGKFIPAGSIRPVDVTGAGDAALAAAVFALDRGMSLFTAARAGQIAAGITAEVSLTVAPNLTAQSLTDALAQSGA